MKRFYPRLVLFTACLALVVVIVGAYVRLNDSGLGCPDWPGCYGALSPAHAENDIANAVRAQGGEHGPVALHKAWKEMVHRYLAGTLGLLVLAIAIGAWVQRRSRGLATSLLALVILQAALGMWTVTLLLKPVIVTLHLLGGMATLSLLAWLAARESRFTAVIDIGARRLRPWAAIGLAIVVAQIALGGWVSSNYAALACIDFPTCHGVWRPEMDFKHGFQLVRELGRTASGTHLAYEALTAIHWTHRVGALITFVYVSSLAWALRRERGLGRFAALLAALVVLQVALGISNVLMGLPLGIAVAHNGVAAVLLVSFVMLNFALNRKPIPLPRS